MIKMCETASIQGVFTCQRDFLLLLFKMSTVTRQVLDVNEKPVKSNMLKWYLRCAMTITVESTAIL